MDALFPSPARRDAVLSDAACRRAWYDPGEILYAPRTFDRCLGVILSGRVRVTKGGLTMSVLSAGDLFGAAALFLEEGEEYASTLTAVTRCEAALLPEAYVRRLMREEPGFAEGYAAYLASRVRFLAARISALAAGDAADRVECFLTDSADGNGRVTLSAAELARRVGVGRATLYRAFAFLEQSGVIHREGKHIILTPPQK